MPPATHGALTQEQRIDEAALESFPASDAPSWSTTHAGVPAPPPWPAEHGRELRALLRADLERLERRGRGMDASDRRRFREELVARAMLEAGRAVLREPVDGPGVRNVETYLLGAVRDAPCVVLGARYDVDDVTRIAALLAIVRSLGCARMGRTVRLVAFADSPSLSGSARYAERLKASGVRVHAMMAIATLDLARGETSDVVFLGDLGARSLLDAAVGAFRMASRIPARKRSRPRFWPGMGRAPVQKDFGRFGWPSMLITERAVRLRSGRREPDADRIVAAVSGLVAAVEHLAGGRV